MSACLSSLGFLLLRFDPLFLLFARYFPHRIARTLFYRISLTQRVFDFFCFPVISSLPPSEGADSLAAAWMTAKSAVLLTKRAEMKSKRNGFNLVQDFMGGEKEIKRIKKANNSKVEVEGVVGGRNEAQHVMRWAARKGMLTVLGFPRALTSNFVHL